MRWLVSVFKDSLKMSNNMEKRIIKLFLITGAYGDIPIYGILRIVYIIVCVCVGGWVGVFVWVCWCVSEHVCAYMRVGVCARACVHACVREILSVGKCIVRKQIPEKFCCYPYFFSFFVPKMTKIESCSDKRNSVKIILSYNNVQVLTK